MVSLTTPWHLASLPPSAADPSMRSYLSCTLSRYHFRSQWLMVQSCSERRRRFPIAVITGITRPSLRLTNYHPLDVARPHASHTHLSVSNLACPSHLHPSKPHYNPAFWLPNNLGTHHIVPIKQVPAVPPVMDGPHESVRLRRGGEGDDVCRCGVFCDSAGGASAASEEAREKKEERFLVSISGCLACVEAGRTLERARYHTYRQP